MQMLMVEIPPAGELTEIEAIAILSGLAAGTAALPDTSLDQQRIAPKDCTCFSGIEQTGDVCERLCLAHAVQNRQSRLRADLRERASEGPPQLRRSQL